MYTLQVYIRVDHEYMMRISEGSSNRARNDTLVIFGRSWDFPMANKTNG